MGEADLMVTIFSREWGMLRVMAKGARRSTSKLVGHLEPLTRVKLSLAQGRSMDLITQAQMMGNFDHLKNDLAAITKGLYVAELLDGFSSEASPNQSLYYLAVETLGSIGQNPGSEWPLRFFELQLLLMSGLMPELYRCVECRQPLSAGRHRFSPSLGGALCLDCHPVEANVRPLSLRALKVLRLLHRGSLKEIIPLQVAGDLERELKSLLTITVRYWLEREIRSNSFLEQLYQESKSGVYT
jgi:DNA repair protein RecO (recombination protein O)